MKAIKPKYQKRLENEDTYLRQTARTNIEHLTKLLSTEVIAH